MKFQKTWAMLITIFIGISMLFIGCGKSEESGTKTAKILPKLTVGIQVSPAMTLVMVAEDKGFFDKAGVDVEIKEFTAGKFALQAFLGGSLDIAVSGEVPVTLSTLQGNKFRVLAQVVEKTINECRVVVQKEEGLDTAEKYFLSQKRKLATSFGGGPEFFTYNFLKKHSIADDKIELISQRPEDMPAALSSGTVDAISIFDPFARIAEVSMGDKGLTFADADIYSELYVVDVMQKTIDEKPEQLMAFLKGLYDAQFYIKDHPDESKEVLIKYTKLDRDIVNDIWDNFVFKPAINNLFIDYTTAEAKWAIEKGTFPAGTQIPDFRLILYPDFLKKIDPKAVEI
jgi:ABC-type nitrate/sulfonate/bicarbonate transport system substrate-binding protein